MNRGKNRVTLCKNRLILGKDHVRGKKVRIV